MTEQKEAPAFLRGQRNLKPDPAIIREALATISPETFEVSLVRSRSNTAGVGCFKVVPGVTIMFPFIVKDLEDGTRVMESYDIATKLDASVNDEIRGLLEEHRDEITANLAAAIKNGLN